MSRFRFELAGPADDAALRALLRENPMEGRSLRVAFEREPSFFAAARVGSAEVQVGVAREANGNRIVGLGTRALRRAWVNGEVSERVGYLGDLRLTPAHRGGTLVARGYRFLRDLHRDDRAETYYTVVFADNAPALATLAAGRGGLPVYEDLGRLLCPGLRLHGRVPRGGSDPVGLTVGRGRVEDLPGIVACLNRFGRRRQFAPVYAEADFTPGATARFPDFGVHDFFVARRGGTIVGVSGAWDQRPFKQTRVHALGGALRWLAPVANFLRPLAPRRVPPFPRPGETLPFLYAAFLGVDNDDPAVLRALLRAMVRAFAGGEFLYLLVGMHERDPLTSALAEFTFPFAGRLFRVRLDDAGPEPDGRVPYVEAATL